ncbi:hypothetical protein Salat_2909800 [Sesamum alatum]|uniref:DUF4283 domain-containing protein n=1 Tax=Sesamum alatum TaxID=300844 RepID=A0AAE1XIM3_9LAMI|nr:hypothetical protein Salat_2909800 [Sesamum alatum]
MTDDLYNLGKALPYSDDEQRSIILPLGIWDGDVEPQGFFLVGKLPGRRHFNFEAFKATMSNSFNPGRGLEIRLIEEGRLLFKFNHILDRRRVLDSGPWSFEKHLLVLQPVEDNENPSRIDLNWAEFYIHVHDLPLKRMTKDITAFIGNQLGVFKEVDLDRGGQG